MRIPEAASAGIRWSAALLGPSSQCPPAFTLEGLAKIHAPNNKNYSNATLWHHVLEGVLIINHSLWNTKRILKPKTMKNI